jgi:RNA polymerase-binding transcription factor DksA
MTNATDLAAVEASLRARLAALTSDIDGLEADRRAPLDADFSEQATELAGQDAIGGIEDNKVAEVAAIHAALARIADGSYGVCSNCGADIPAARMAAMPTATACIKCAA